MSEEEIIKRRLLIDGDGTGDDRRLNMLLKQFLKWTFVKTDTPENNQIIYDRLLAQAAQCEFSAAKSEHTAKMIDEELKSYAKLSEAINKSIELAQQDIEETKEELVVAKEIRKNKMEYDTLARKIKEQPDRQETNKKIETLRKELAELMEKKLKLERKFEKRRKDFTLLMYAMRELEAQLEDESSSESSKSDDENEGPAETMDISDDDEPSTSSNSTKVDEKIIKKEVDDDDTSKERMSIDEDTVLELSIEKDENDVGKLEENTNHA